MIEGAAKAGWRVGRLVLVGAALVLPCGALGAGALQSPGCLDGGAPAVVSGLDPPFDLRLEDGRRVRLAGLDTTSAATADETRDRLATWLVGRTVRVAPRTSAPDRWGRTPALVFAAGGSSTADRSVSVGEALLEAGLARARPDDKIAPCWPAYLRLEDQARTALRGLWADPRNGVIAAADTPALQARLGSFVVVDGAVASLREGRARTYLRFADAPADSMAVSLDRRTLQRFGKMGVVPSAWLHRRVRVRGVLDDRWGLQIEVATPEQVELVGP